MSRPSRRGALGTALTGDLQDTGLLTETLRTHLVAAVMHFAALANVGEAVGDPEAYYRTNVGGTLSLLSAMRDAGVARLVFSSTCAVYGIPSRVPIDETTPLMPLNPYGETKLAVEKTLHWYGEAYGLRSVALRYFNAAGASPDGDIGENHDPETHLIPLPIRAALEGAAPMHGYGTANSVLGWSPRHSDLDNIVGTALRWHTRSEASAPAGNAEQAA